MSHISDDDVWGVIGEFFSENGILRHQIEAMNVFYDDIIPTIFDTFKKNVISTKGTLMTYTVEFYNPVLLNPKYNPTEAIMKNTSYVSELYIDIIITPPVGDKIFYPKTFIGNVPVMKYSALCNLTPWKNNFAELAKRSECVYDTGGYFITRVISKDTSRETVSHKMVIIPQERATPNKIFTFENLKTKPQFKVYSEIRSATTNGFHTLFRVGYIEKTGTLNVILPKFEHVIPLFIVFKALGIEDIHVIKTMIFENATQQDLHILQRTYEFSFSTSTQLDALVYIGQAGKDSAKRRKKYTKDDDIEEKTEQIDAIPPVEHALNVLGKELFSHLILQQRHLQNETTTLMYNNVEYIIPKGIFRMKAQFLALMVKSTLDVLHKRVTKTDRDHFSFKRIMDVSVLLEQQLRSAMIKLIKEVRRVAVPALQSGTGADIFSAIKPSIITGSLIGAIAANKWERNTANGVSQILETFNFTGGEANKRKITVPIVAEGSQLTDPRDLHPSHYAVACPADTPEGKATGLKKNLAMSGLITFSSGPGVPEALFNVLLQLGLKLFTTDISPKNATFVHINGDLCGYVLNPEDVAKKFREIRRRGDISREVSVSWNASERSLRVYCDGGRLVYPAIIIDETTLLPRLTPDIVSAISRGEMSWNKLCSDGIVELIDKDEEENVVLANYPSQVFESPGKYTHIELHPSLIYGVSANLIPFPDHNQSPRNCYQSSMQKQAIGIPQTNYKKFLYSKFHVLEYVQRPLVLSRIGVMLKFNLMPSGINAMTCFMPGKFNEEDSIMINKASVQRGFMVSHMYISFFVEAKNNDVFKRPDIHPDNVTCTTNGDNDTKYVGYTHLLTYNFSKLCEDGYTPKGTRVEFNDVVICKITTLPNGKQNVYTQVYTEKIHAVVDRIEHGETDEKYKYVRVMVVQRREPMMGDKFEARHAQKGTLGMLVEAVDMPFNRSGDIPDIIVNTLAFPSRMTIAMLIELITGKTLCYTSDILNDATCKDLNDALNEANGIIEFNQMFHSSDETQIDSTPFRRFSLPLIVKELRRVGVHMLCDDVFYNGTNGQRFKCLVFHGPIYYQKLKHMVIDKIHARARGPRTTIARQPTEGRKYEGGMRNGVQERDNFIGVGVPNIAKDRLFTNSDNYAMWFCDVCGLPAVYNPQMKSGICKLCSTTKVSNVPMPYGTKLILQELAAMNIFSRVMTTKFQ